MMRGRSVIQGLPQGYPNEYSYLLCIEPARCISIPRGTGDGGALREILEAIWLFIYFCVATLFPFEICDMALQGDGPYDLDMMLGA